MNKIKELFHAAYDAGTDIINVPNAPEFEEWFKQNEPDIREALSTLIEQPVISAINGIKAASPYGRCDNLKSAISSLEGLLHFDTIYD